MSVSIDDLKQFAENLSNANGECEWRSAASRGYYAIYHKTLGVADACLPQNPHAIGEHERLTERLKQAGMKGRSLAYRIIDLKKVRTRADYDLAANFAQQDAVDLIGNCPSVFNQADEFLAHVSAQQASKP